MDNIFENQIDTDKFRSTNGIWNELQLNSPWAVGYVTTLIESKTFNSKEEWKDFYYKSGEERLAKISELEGDIQKILQDFNLPYNKKQSIVNGLHKEIKDLNYLYGRTESDLRLIGKRMFDVIEKRGNKLSITLSECIYMVKYRILAETWNGIISREKNTIERLKRAFPNKRFNKVDGDFDYKYGVDYEIYDGDILIGAIQIKPKSYMNGNSESIKKAKKANEIKNLLYYKAFGVNVSYIYSNTKGEILNPNALFFLSNINEAVS